MTRVSAGALLAALATATVAGTARAQEESPVHSRILAALDTRLVQPDCKLEGSGDFRVSSGRTYLKTAIEGTSDPVKRDNALRSGVRVISDAITESGQGKNPSAWYYLGRLYLQQGDLSGADSAFARAQALAPACKEDIGRYRYRAWAALVNAASGFRQSQQEDSAMVMYRAANEIHQDLPLAYVNMADMFATGGQTDSALVYFGKAAATQPTDANQIKVRDQAVFNHGVVLLNANRPKDAIAAFRRFLAIQPEDVTAKKGLAQAFRAADMPDSAQALERELVSASGTAGEEVSEADLFSIAVQQFNDKDYKSAAATFTRITASNPFHRDALFNLANAYLALEDGAKLAETAEKLVAIEPLSEYDHRLWVTGNQMVKNQEGTIKSFTALEALPVNLEVQNMKVSGDGASLTGQLTGREPKDQAGKPLAPKAVPVTVEFLGAGGTVVASADVEIPVLKPGETAPFTAEGKGAGIKGWRYKVR